MSQRVQTTYSAIKTFQTCPRQYYEKYVVKSVKFVQGPEAIFGDQVHKTIEDNIKHNVPVPQEHSQFAKAIEAVKGWQAKGTVFVERKLAVNHKLEACDYWDKDYFIRGKADLSFVSASGTKGRVIDWKTGKNSKFADMKQIEMMSLLLMKNEPTVQVVEGRLVFLVLNQLIPTSSPAKYERAREKEAWQQWLFEVHKIENAMERNMWPPQPNNLCKKWCDVMSCEFNGRNEA